MSLALAEPVAKGRTVKSAAVSLRTDCRNARIDTHPAKWRLVTELLGLGLVLEKDNRRIVVQAKRWKKVVGIEAVQQIIGAIKYYSSVKGMVITNSVFTENAYELARANGVELIDREKLIEIMRKSQGKNISKAPLEGGEHETDKTFGILPDENCPVCGRVLVKRKGKFGAFIGCSGFPGCRFTKQV